MLIPRSAGMAVATAYRRSARTKGKAISSDSRRTSAASQRSISQNNRGVAGSLSLIRAQARHPASDLPPERQFKPLQRAFPTPGGGVSGNAEAETPD